MVAVVLAVFSQGSSLLLTMPVSAVESVQELSKLINQSGQVERWSVDGLIVRFTSSASPAWLETHNRISTLLGQLGWLSIDPMEDADFALTLGEQEILDELYPTIGLGESKYYKSSPKSVLQVIKGMTVPVSNNGEIIENVTVVEFELIEGGEVIADTLEAAYNDKNSYQGDITVIKSPADLVLPRLAMD